MPQETNLNVAPYFDDFDSYSNYCKILFKPGLPVQARELTGIQSILQNQIEKFGEHIFKDGASVTGGGVVYNPGEDVVRIERSNEGIDVDSYIEDLTGAFLEQEDASEVVVIGSESGVKARIKSVNGQGQLESEWYLLFVQYIETGGEDNTVFLPGESLLLDGKVLETNNNLIFQPGEPVCQVVSEDAIFTGASAYLSAGIYYIRGYFLEVEAQSVVLDPYDTEDLNTRIGLSVKEEIVNSDLDESLTDNAAGFNNYTAPGADRLAFTVELNAIDLDEVKPANFIELITVINGVLADVKQDRDYNKLEEEFARRTFDESGNYYVNPYSLTPRNTLNDYEGNDGIFTSEQTTYNNNTPSDDLGTYKLSPGKAYIEGYEIETVVPGFLDFPKPRTVNTLENQSINYVSGPTFTLNNVSGSPTIGIGTNYTVSLRDSRIGSATTTASGKEIGLARVYDFALESGSYNVSNDKVNEWDIALYDIQTYTNITLNTATTLSVPTHIKGKSSGATGYLRYGVTAGTALTAYNTKGKFITGEQYIFNGVESGNISVGSTSYNTSDIKSIHGTVSTASTFSGDVKQSVLSNIGEVNISIATTSGTYLGISTVTNTDPTRFFTGIATVGNLVEYTNTNINGISTISYAKVESVSQNSLTISGVTTVTGICEGGLPQAVINPSNFKIVSSLFQSSEDNTLYTKFPKNNVKSVNLNNSNITIRKQFDVNITDNSTGVISSGSADETFLPYDEEDYVLIRTDGTTEKLSPDKFDFNVGSTNITINGLGSNDSAKLIATLRKINVKEKIKEKQKINILSIVNSQNSQSGVGTTALNDGLTYSTLYGSRVQDEEISLNIPDVTKVYGIFESANVSAPTFPQVVLSSINSATAKTGDLLIGEKFIGKDSKCLGIYVSRENDSTINYIKLNEIDLQVNEIVTFQESDITATVSSTVKGSENITQEFTYDDGQRNTIYDFGRLIRKPNYNPPTKQLKVVFESAYFTASDKGDITTPSSYDNFNYRDLPDINDTRVSDIIDIRPRVSEFSGTTRSPFEFLGRSFTADGNSAQNILASDKSILLDYSYYLPRLDKIYLSKDGTFELVQGSPAEKPEFPAAIDGALEVASISLPAYLFNINDVSVELADYKRYQMSDINRLERRIENLEFYTSLSLLENDTINMQITDVDGLNRFKSGFFVDDFSNTDNQLKTTIVKNSIDYHYGELRPSHHTTELDLQIDLNSSNGIRKTGNVLTLDYDDVVHLEQPFATRVENVTPYLVNYYGGSVQLSPSSDIWVDQVILDAKKGDLTTYTNTASQLSASEFDKRSGYGPVTWGSWKNNWTGYKQVSQSSTQSWRGNNLVRTTTTTKQRTGTKTRKGTKKLVRETFSTINKGPKVLNTQLISYLRSRNLKFDGRKLKPSTRVYGFFDGQEIAKYLIPKLLEISMTTGTFAVGETVIGTNKEGKELIRFKVAQSNHKRGPFDDPTQIYKANPYYAFSPLYKGLAILVDSIVPTQSKSTEEDTTTEVSASGTSSELVTVPELYSTTSSILNIDLDTLASKSDNTFFGYIEKNLKLVGQTSNAQATIINNRLRTDTSGSVIGSFFIPDPNKITSPKFDTGKKVFRLTSNKFNSQIPGNVHTDATEPFESTGKIETLQSTIITVKNIATDVLTRTETTSASGPKSSTSSQRVVGRRNPPSRRGRSGGNVKNNVKKGTIITCTRRNPPPCPTPDMKILLADGSTKPAGELQVGDEVDTFHENTLERGSFKVTSVETVKYSVIELDFSGRKIKCSPDHKFYCNSHWVTASHLDIGDRVSFLDGYGIKDNQVELTNYTQLGEGDVVKIEIENASTYICEGFLSHNKTRKPKRSIDYITSGYRAVLGRNPDAGGKAYWHAEVEKEMKATGVKKGTTSYYAIARSKVVAKIKKSQEAINKGVASITQAQLNRSKASRSNKAFAAGKTKRGGRTAAQYKAMSKAKPDCPYGTDPLAQSFRIGDPSGIYVTKVDVYFGSKDDILPVVVQLRTMKAGVPTTKIIPFSEVTIDPEDVKISEDASIPTTVTFESPVYLPPDQTYALVLLSISNDYTAWISRMGETDVQTVNNPESEQIVVSSQPTLGSLFKSQNGETWNPSQYEDLKFTLYKGIFKERTGSINFHNPPLLTYSEDVPPLLKDAFEITSNKIRVGFNTTISDTGITLGNLVQQDGSNASGRYVGSAGTATGNLTITNSGIGFTPSSGNWTYQDVSLNTITGYGRNATANITISNGVASAATIANGGSGYVVGDVVGITSVGVNSLGRDIKFSIGSITGTNEFVLDSVQGEFVTGVGKTIQYVTSAGIVTLNHAVGGNVWLSGAPVVDSDGVHIKVNQKNHGMYSTQNIVTIENVSSDTPSTLLAADYDNESTGSIVLDDATNFAEFENVGVGSTNLGYIKVGSEILSYTGLTANTLTGVTRGVDSTKTLSHDTSDSVYKYEFNGVSLRRINTNHNLANATVTDAIGLDHYNIKIDMSANGVDRSVGTSLPILHFNQTKSAGGPDILSTENIAFEVLTPITQTATPSGSNVGAQIRTVTGTSIDGSESPFQDKGFEEISLDGDNYMSSPRIIASRINETTSLPTLPDNKSFTMTLNLYGADDTISPIVDLDRMGVILTSNRVNNPINDWITDNRVNTLRDDPNAFVYASEPVTLKSGATAIKIHLQGHINLTSDIRALYAIADDPNDDLIYEPFPGYPNLVSTGQVIDPAKNSGLPDKALPKTDVIAYDSEDVVWNDYEFTVDNLPTFRHFSIKLVGTGTNQAQPPRMQSLKVIALA